jgi:hypothetical protein
MGPHLRIAAIGFFALLIAACKDPGGDRTPVRQRSSAATPDRLLASEELPGQKRVFGIEVPPGLTVSAQFADRAQLRGRVELNTVLKALQKQLVTGPVEYSPRRAVFANALVSGDSKKRVYRIELVAERNLTSVQILDVTPPPVTEGLSETQRWDRAGRNPDGTLKDRLKVH